MIKAMKAAVAASSILMLAACGTTSSPGMYPGSSTQAPMSTSASSASGFGVVQSIETMSRDQANRMGLGTVAGAVLGGVLGNQVGGGSGRTAATVAGAVGGAYAGNRMEQSSGSAGNAVYRVTVRMDNGAMQTVAQENIGALQTGDRVRLSNGAIVERYR